MSNSAPLWLTVVLAAITSVSAVIAALLTTWLTSRYGNNRLLLEIRHQRSQESRKLLFDQRFNVYVRAINEMTDVDKVLSAGRKSIAEAAADERLAVASGVVEELAEVSHEYLPLNTEMRLLASRAVLESRIRFIRLSTKAVSLIPEKALEGDLSEFDAALKKLVQVNGELVALMQNDLGVKDANDT